MERSKRFLILFLLDTVLLSTRSGFSQRLPAFIDSKPAGPYDSWSFSDLDGDNRPDLALGRSAAAGYTIEIRYSNRSETALLVLGPGATVVRCAESDIDRDNDQDLLVSSIGVLEHRAVWVNDGQGHFFRSDKSANVYLPAAGLTSNLQPNCSPQDRAALNLSERFPIDRTRWSRLCPIVGSGLSAALDFPGPTAKLTPDRLATRGPPLA